MMTRIAFALILVVSGAHAVAEQFTAGQHYEIVTPAQPTRTGEGKIEVVELFWYGCPHCFAFEPHVDEWLDTKADNVEFVRVPAVFARNWEVHARAYYAAEQLGVVEKIHRPLFDALHTRQRKIFTEDALAAFFAEQGITEADFREAFHSFGVDTKTRAAIAATRSYGITGVPAVIVNGKYRSSARATGNFENLLKLVDFLAAKESTP